MLYGKVLVSFDDYGVVGVPSAIYIYIWQRRDMAGLPSCRFYLFILAAARVGGGEGHWYPCCFYAQQPGTAASETIDVTGWPHGTFPTRFILWGDTRGIVDRHSM